MTRRAARAPGHHHGCLFFFFFSFFKGKAVLRRFRGEMNRSPIFFSQVKALEPWQRGEIIMM
jgi:hypothetical protein